jgi:hypothetical protein
MIVLALVVKAAALDSNIKIYNNITNNDKHFPTAILKSK